MAASKPARKATISGGKGKPPVTFKKGGLHDSVGVPQGQKIPAAKMAAAAAGKFGPKAAAQANMAQGMLKTGRQTAAANRLKKRTPTAKRAATPKTTPKGK